MKKVLFAVAIALSTTACADAMAARADVSTPTSLAGEGLVRAAGRPSAGPVDEGGCPASITVVSVKPLHGSVGYTWVHATYLGGDTAAAPTWAISAGADIRADNDNGFYAYIMAPTGRYTVRAVGPCGVAGELVIDHVITKP